MSFKKKEELTNYVERLSTNLTSESNNPETRPYSLNSFEDE